MKTTVVIGHVTWLTDCGYNQFTDCSHNVAKIVGVTNVTLTEAVEDCFNKIKHLLLSDLPTAGETPDGHPVFPGNYKFPKHNLRMEVISGELVLQVCRNGGDKVALIPTIDDDQGDPIVLIGIKPAHVAQLDLRKIED